VTPDGLLIRSPDFRFARTLHDVFLHYLEVARTASAKGMPDCRSLHRNHIVRMLLDRHMMGETGKAMWWFRELKRLYEPNLALTYDEYIKKNLHAWLIKDITPENAVGLILGLLEQYYRLRALDDEFDAYFMGRRARYVYNYCQREYKEMLHRMGLPPFRELNRRALEDIFRGRRRWPRFLVNRLKRILGEEWKKYAKPQP
jgi:hypothetical protein